jgi:small-conductance mechanosensitive channel
VPPKKTPEDISDEDFENNLKTEDGRKFLEEFRTTKGLPIGSYEQLVKDPFEEWKKSERGKYADYLKKCISGDNQSGKKLRLGQEEEEVYPIDTWREEKRLEGFEPIIPGGRPPGYATRKRKNLPKSISQILPLGIFAAVIIGVISWWGIDLIVLATATGGLAIGIGLALQETMQNYFAYILIRKDKIFAEGERIKLDTGYNGYVHKITPRVTYIRDALHESFAIIPTRQLVNAQIINYSKEIKMVPAIVDVGVSYLNDPKQVAAILVKVGKRAMKETVDSKGRHLVVQLRCPYLENNKPSCGCDKDIHVDISQPVVRFNKFNDSSLDFSLWLYVRDYGSQFKTKTDMRMIMYEEFKKYDIRIPWPIRTVYQGDEKQEQSEINKLDEQRDKVIDKYGIGDIGRGSGEE